MLLVDFTTEVGVNASTDIQGSLTYLTNLRKVIKIVATGCQILRLKCTKFAEGAYSAPQTYSCDALLLRGEGRNAFPHFFNPTLTTDCNPWA